MTSSSRAVLREVERQQGQEQSAPENVKVFAGRAGFATKTYGSIGLSAAEVEERRRKQLAESRLARLVQVREAAKALSQRQVSCYKEQLDRLTKEKAGVAERRWREEQKGRVETVAAAVDGARAGMGGGQRSAGETLAEKLERSKRQVAEMADRNQAALARHRDAIAAQAESRAAELAPFHEMLQRRAVVQNEEARRSAAVVAQCEEAERRREVEREEGGAREREALQMGLPSTVDYRYSRLHELGVPLVVEKHKQAGPDGRGTGMTQAVQEEQARLWKLEKERNAARVAAEDREEKRTAAARLRVHMEENKRAIEAELERQRQDKLRATAKAAEEGVLQTRFLQSMQARQKKASAQKYFEQHVMDEVVQWSGSAPVGEAAREAEASLSERPATGWPCDEGWEPSLAGSDTGATTRVAEVGGPVGGLARQSAEPGPPVAKDGVQTSHDNDHFAGGAPVNRSSHRSTATEAIPIVEQPSADKEQRDGGKEQTRSSRQEVSFKRQRADGGGGGKEHSYNGSKGVDASGAVLLDRVQSWRQATQSQAINVSTDCERHDHAPLSVSAPPRKPPAHSTWPTKGTAHPSTPARDASEERPWRKTSTAHNRAVAKRGTLPVRASSKSARPQSSPPKSRGNGGGGGSGPQPRPSLRLSPRGSSARPKGANATTKQGKPSAKMGVRASISSEPRGRPAAMAKRQNGSAAITRRRPAPPSSTEDGVSQTSSEPLRGWSVLIDGKANAGGAELVELEGELGIDEFVQMPMRSSAAVNELAAVLEAHQQGVQEAADRALSAVEAAKHHRDGVKAIHIAGVEEEEAPRPRPDALLPVAAQQRSAQLDAPSSGTVGSKHQAITPEPSTAADHALAVANEPEQTDYTDAMEAQDKLTQDILQTTEEVRRLKQTIRERMMQSPPASVSDMSFQTGVEPDWPSPPVALHRNGATRIAAPSPSALDDSGMAGPLDSPASSDLSGMSSILEYERLAHRQMSGYDSVHGTTRSKQHTGSGSLSSAFNGLDHLQPMYAPPPATTSSLVASASGASPDDATAVRMQPSYTPITSANEPEAAPPSPTSSGFTGLSSLLAGSEARDAENHRRADSSELFKYSQPHRFAEWSAREGPSESSPITASPSGRDKRRLHSTSVSIASSGLTGISSVLRKAAAGSAGGDAWSDTAASSEPFDGDAALAAAAADASIPLGELKAALSEAALGSGLYPGARGAAGDGGGIEEVPPASLSDADDDGYEKAIQEAMLAAAASDSSIPLVDLKAAISEAAHLTVRQLHAGRAVIPGGVAPPPASFSHPDDGEHVQHDILPEQQADTSFSDESGSGAKEKEPPHPVEYTARPVIDSTAQDDVIKGAQGEGGSEDWLVSTSEALQVSSEVVGVHDGAGKQLHIVRRLADEEAFILGEAAARVASEQAAKVISDWSEDTRSESISVSATASTSQGSFPTQLTAMTSSQRSVTQQMPRQAEGTGRPPAATAQGVRNDAIFEEGVTVPVEPTPGRAVSEVDSEDIQSMLMSARRFTEAALEANPLFHDTIWETRAETSRRKADNSDPAELDALTESEAVEEEHTAAREDDHVREAEGPGSREVTGEGDAGRGDGEGWEATLWPAELAMGKRSRTNSSTPNESYEARRLAESTAELSTDDLLLSVTKSMEVPETCTGGSLGSSGFGTPGATPIPVVANQPGWLMTSLDTGDFKSFASVMNKMPSVGAYSEDFGSEGEGSGAQQVGGTLSAEIAARYARKVAELEARSTEAAAKRNGARAAAQAKAEQLKLTPKGGSTAPTPASTRSSNHQSKQQSRGALEAKPRTAAAIKSPSASPAVVGESTHRQSSASGRAARRPSGAAAPPPAGTPRRPSPTRPTSAKSTPPKPGRLSVWR